MPNERLFDLTIRVAEMNDAAALAQLMCELGYGTTKSEMQMRLQRIATDERYRTFVAVCGGKVCGMIGTLTYPSYEHNDPSGRIVALVILSNDAPPRNWSRADCNCRERFRPKRNQARRFEHTACPGRCPQVLRIAWLRAKRMAVCEATFGARLIGLDMARLSVLAITAVAVIAIPQAQAVDTSSNAAETEGRDSHGRGDRIANFDLARGIREAEDAGSRRLHSQNER